jgi:hypothetical protein
MYRLTRDIEKDGVTILSGTPLMGLYEVSREGDQKFLTQVVIDGARHKLTVRPSDYEFTYDDN